MHSWRIETVWTGVLAGRRVCRGGAGEKGAAAMEEAEGNRIDLRVGGLGFEVVVGIRQDHLRGK